MQGRVIDQEVVFDVQEDGIQFNYAKSGEDWPDVMCKFGKEQSPINVALAGGLSSVELCAEVA